MQDPNTLIKELLEAGVHFGHRTNRWNPKMAKFIFGEKNGIYIVDLQRTVEGLKEACEFLKGVASKGEYILFVGTKKQAKDIIRERAKKCEVFYVVERWLGGTLTNFTTIRQSVKRLEELEKLKESQTFELLSKKERAQIVKELDKLIRNLEGIRGMSRLPSVLFVIDSKTEEIAINEANKLSIPVVALIDTNSDPDRVDYIIPGNDDAIKSIELITQIVGDSILEGRQQHLEDKSALEEEGIKKEAPIKADEEEIEKLVDEKDVKDEVKEERIKRRRSRTRRKQTGK